MVNDIAMRARASADSGLLIDYLAVLPQPAALLELDPEDDRSLTYSYCNAAFPPQLMSSVLDSAKVSIVDGTNRLYIAYDTTEIPSSFALDEPWEWTIRKLRNRMLYVVEGSSRRIGSETEQDGRYPSRSTTPATMQIITDNMAQNHLPAPLLPTPDNPNPFPSRTGPDSSNYSHAVLDHNALFLSLNWATTPLGPISRWPSRLRGIVQTMMASPFPALISYGPEYVLLYNEPYSKVIGRKHPAILGLEYGVAWPEVWGALEPIVKAAYQGKVLHVSSAWGGSRG
jgi:hypothetical protein